jgi:hypothetical protein
MSTNKNQKKDLFACVIIAAMLWVSNKWFMLALPSLSILLCLLIIWEMVASQHYFNFKNPTVLHTKSMNMGQTAWLPWI